MADLALCAPMRIEAALLRRGPLPVVRTGYGVRRSSRSAARLTAFGALIVTGFGGGLCHDAEPGDVVVATELRYHDRIRVLPRADAIAAALRRALSRVVTGPIVTTDRIVAGRNRTALDGAAVDMESFVLAEVAGDRVVGVVRVLADTPRRPVPLTGGIRAARVLSALPSLLTRGAGAW